MSTTPAIVCALSVSLASAALAGAPPVADLGLLPGDATVTLAHSSQQDHSIALGDGQYLLVWSETRAQNVGNGTNESWMDIFGIRLDLDGNPIDTVPFAITAAAGYQKTPKVAWNGELWLVTFISQDPVGQYFGDNVRGVRVASDGTVLDSTPILLVAEQPYWTIAGHNGQWLVAWTAYYPGGYGTYLAGRRLGSNGAFLDAAPVTLMDWVWWLPGSKLLASDNEYLAVIADWNDSSVTKARRIGFDGQPIGAPFTVPSKDVASSGSEYYVVWLKNFTNLVGSRMTSTGALLTPAGTTITTNYSSFYSATVTHDGSTWWVAWSAANLLRAARVDANGTVLDPGGKPVPHGAVGANDFMYAMTLAPVPGGGALVAWWDGRASLNGDANVFGVRLDAQNSAGPELPLSLGRPSQRAADFAGGPDGRMAVAFLSEVAGQDRVLVHLLDASGVPLNGEPIEVASGPTLGAPSIAFNGEIYLVAWHDTSVKARRMHVDGTFLDATPIAVMTGFNVGVDAVGDDFLVASTRFGATTQFIFVHARRIDGPTGAFLDPGPLTLGGGYVSIPPRVRNDGSRWMVAYHSHWSHNSSQSDVIYNFVNPDGTFTPGVNPTPVSGATGTPDMAFSGAKYLIVWRSNTMGQPNNFISGRIMNPDGSFATGAFVIAEAAGRQLRPVVDWDGSTFVVAWDDQRHQTSFFDERTDIYGARVSESGTVLDPGGIPLQVSPHPNAMAAIQSRSDGTSWVACSRFLAAPGFDSYRIGLTRLGELGLLGDLNGDGLVDGADLGLLLANWGPTGGGPAAGDLNGDGVVDGADIGLLLAAWLG